MLSPTALSKASSTKASISITLSLGQLDLNLRNSSSADSGEVSQDLAANNPNYDPFFYDVLVGDRICSRDIPFLQRLQTNAIRTYGIDPSQDHSGCMNELANAGIYVLADLVTPGLTISTTNPV